MSQNAYEIDLYPTKAQPQLHIGNLYAAAYLRGFDPPRIETATVLEVGCGTGLNLLPMARTLPGAEFVGVDYAARPIEIAKSLAERMEIPNIRFHAADIRDLADDFGSYDYILVHGFYSWAPADAREALWRVAQGSLTPRGVIQVSYNCLPGWLQNQWLRDFCLEHMKRFPDRETKLREAWKLIEALASMKEADNPYPIIAAQTVEKGFATAIHDELAEINEPFYLNEVVAHAGAYGFQYLSDAVQKYVPGLQHLSTGEEILASITGEGGTLREQYKDFLSMRTFRQSLFTPASNQPSPASYLELLRHCRVTSPLRASATDEEGNRVFDSPLSVLGFHSNNPLIASLFEAIAVAYPAPVALGEVSDAMLRAVPSPAPAQVAEYWDLVEDLSRNGVLQTSSREIPIPAALPRKPAMAGIASWEALLGLPLTSLFHRSLPFPDPMHRALAALTDGSRDVPEICSTLASMIQLQKASGKPEIVIEGFPIPLLSSQALHGQEALLDDPEAIRGFLLRTVPIELERFRLAGLIVEPVAGEPGN
ncbi:MAG: class I SAM-dependent methyltransferase [Bryobacterales bacterium]|nr:class I SAM-dependent methyltransferase [Bryobacterales bacterium]